MLARYNLILTLLALAVTHSVTHGQTPGTVTLQQKVEPSYRIEPVVQRSKARRGEVLPFSFLMTSTGKDLDIDLQPVQLRQEESGIIMHDSNSPPSLEIRFTSPQKFQLSAGKEQAITGEITIPKTKSNFYSFGILVRDQGQFPDFSNNPANANQPKVKAGVRFITQYVIRIDVDVDGTTDNDLQHLKFESGKVQSVNGKPVAEVYMNNPTENTIELQLRGQLNNALSDDLSKREFFHFTMPCRSTLEGPERTTIRILPQARLRLEAPVTGDIVAGENQLQVGIRQGSRDVVQQAFPIAIKSGQFPQLEASLVRIEHQLLVTPGQLLLGSVKNGKRSAVLKFANNTANEQTVTLQTVPLPGAALSGVQLSQTTVTIPAHKTQTVRALLRFPSNQQQNEFGYVTIETQTADQAPRSAKLPVALLANLPQGEMLELGQLQTRQPQPETTEFALPIKNISAGFVPVTAELEVLNEQGDRLVMQSGFGRWDEPGQQSELVFSTTAAFPAGKYQTILRVQTWSHLPPQQRTQEWTFSNEPTPTP